VDQNPLCYAVLGFATRRNGLEAFRSKRAMLRTRQIVVVPVMVVATALCWAADGKSHHKPANSAEEVQTDVTPALETQEDIAPLTPERMPPLPPQVSYSNGQLLVIAHNSTLADILSAVSSETGAVIDVPPGRGGERVAGRMGPGPARDVLAALLNGSQFDYIIIASVANPAGVDHVILIPNANKLESTGSIDNPAVAVSLPNRRPFQEIVPPAKLAPQQDTAEEIEDDSDTPTTEHISEGQEPPAGDGVELPGQLLSPGQAPQVSLQPTGSNPQQPGNGATPQPASPNPRAAHN
jgi:hypothetical protein